MSLFDTAKALRYLSIENMSAKEVRALTDENKLRRIIKYGQSAEYPIKALVHAALDAIKNQELLFEAAMTLKDKESCAYATDKLTDPQLLFQIAQSPGRTGFSLMTPQKVAINKLSDENLLCAVASNQNIEQAFRAAALRKIHNQHMLYQLSQTPETELQLEAVANITDTDVVKRMLSEGRPEEVALALLEKIDDDKVLVYHATTAQSTALRVKASTLCASQAAKATCYKEGNTQVRKALLQSDITPELCNYLPDIDFAAEAAHYFDKKEGVEILTKLGLNKAAQSLQSEIDAARFERVFKHFLEGAPDSSLPYRDILDAAQQSRDEQRVVQLLLTYDRHNEELAQIATKRFSKNDEVLLKLALHAQSGCIVSACKEALGDTASLLQVMRSYTEEYQEGRVLEILDKINDIDVVLDIRRSDYPALSKKAASTWLGKKVYEACAAGTPDVPCLKKLIDGGADLNYKESLESESYTGYGRQRYATALYQAVAHCNQQTVDLLKASGARVDKAYFDEISTYDLPSDDSSYAAAFNDSGHTRIEPLDLHALASERGIRL